MVWARNRWQVKKCCSILCQKLEVRKSGWSVGQSSFWCRKSKKWAEIDWLNISDHFERLFKVKAINRFNAKYKKKTSEISLISFISIKHGQVWPKYTVLKFRITKSLMMAKYGGVDKCPACQKSVYPLEKVFICICICGQKKCI